MTFRQFPRIRIVQLRRPRAVLDTSWKRSTPKGGIYPRPGQTRSRKLPRIETYQGPGTSTKLLR
ncbi:hypothetical protein J6590_008289 [Homalodisca vitripennis]|nr:hypothetical protein J6590_008289 [Homalodisca vitripennis]